MKQKLLLLSLSLLFLTFSKVNAQGYNTGIGFRAGGFENGLTIKHFVKSDAAIEGILGFRPGVFVVTGLYEKHATAFSEPSLKWYYGIGAHIGGIDDGRRYRRYFGDDDEIYDNGLLLGADAILGLEWKMPEIPFTLGVDLHPRLELARGPFLDIEPGFTLRFVF
ncbi:hypothetical protein [Pedobacter puniceum]|jgi:hypothetical protein|uniref:DUF3996 domain-containing protein n=1 Tax=Pedobacter puniceum TaxID=2666136 RepID=A0A7K0FMH8_9SPHI|nr:hypothetical protein [Pedobacter puniceum]MRX47179.1 hypothetical protein [Pedobacter puniceum]